MSNAREIVLDARNWKSQDDFYDSFFRAVGAPGWHGRNLNALRDSISVGRINAIEVPYELRLKNFSSLGAEVRKVVGAFIQLINELHDAGLPVDIKIED